MLIKLILIFTKSDEIGVWDVTRYFLSIPCFLVTVQLQISSQNQTSPVLQSLSGIKTKITPSERQRKRWLRSGSSAVWQQHELPARRESSIAPSTGWLQIKRVSEAASFSERVTDKEVGSSALAIEKYTSTPKMTASVL